MDRLEQLKQLAKAQPENALIHYALGLEWRKSGSPAEAVLCFRRVLALDPGYSAAYRELGRALQESGKPREAVRAFQQGIQIAEANGDLQTAKEMRVFLKRLLANPP